MGEQQIEEKLRLVESLGVHFENKDHLAPVAARILSYAILTGKQGVTFEDLVSNLCASKSTISTHLNHLQDLKKLEYFTKPGDRKKYFIINHDTMIQGINDTLNDWEAQKKLHKEIKEYKIEANLHLSEDEKFNLNFHTIYTDYLNEAIKSITILRDKIEETYKEKPF